MTEMKSKLNLGCGNDIRTNCVNVDGHPLDGVDVVVDLSKVPYPFRDNQFKDILMVSILEHLPNTIATLEEVHRIATKNALVFLRLPYWNSYLSIVDPTHVNSFHQKSFNFFDPSKLECQTRPYYTSARFTVENINYTIPFIGKLIKWPKKNGINRIPEILRIRNIVLKSILEIFAHYFCNVIESMDVYLRVLKA